MTDTYKVMAIVSDYPSGLKTAEQVSSEIGIPATRLKELADGGFAPHYRIDAGEPMFRISDFKKWAAKNLIEKVDGRDLPEPIKIGLSLAELKAARRMPVCLREVVGLFDITGEHNRSGIYFLCLGDELQYIGQSVNVHSRVGQHSHKPFDQVLFLPWAKHDLNRIEGALIRYLNPPLNGKGNRHQGCTAPAEIHQGADNEVLECIRQRYDIPN